MVGRSDTGLSDHTKCAAARAGTRDRGAGRRARAPRAGGLRRLAALARVHCDDLSVLRPNNPSGRPITDLDREPMFTRCPFDDRRCMTASLAHEVHDLHTVQLPSLTIAVSVRAGAGEPLQNCLEELHKRLRSVTVVRRPYTATPLPPPSSRRTTQPASGFRKVIPWAA